VSLVLYDTRTRSKMPFAPIEPGHARVYTCGPTVYAPQHIGNMRSQLFADTLKRALLADGLRVTHVINITDVGHLTHDDVDQGEDKMEAAAEKSGRTAAEVAAEYTEQWRVDRERLGCLPPEVLCKATDHIAEQLALIGELEERGYTYQIEDGVYFDTAKFDRYAEFARLDLAAEAEGARIAAVEGKRNPSDFSLWKFAEAGVVRQQEWDSPWGRGFPGWHVECSAMSRRYLGDHFDIHTGGVDHIKVHHTNEVAQSECAFAETPWVNVWMHNEFLTFGEEKISKSKGHVLAVADLIEQGIEPLAFRYFILQAHYRQQQAFTVEAAQAAATGYRRLLAQAAELRGATGAADPARCEPFESHFRAAMADDLNTPRALAVVFDVLKSDALEPADRRDLLAGFDASLGLGLADAEVADLAQESDPRISALLEERQAARKNRDFATADRIRDELAAEGVEIIDTPEGPRWQRK